MEKNFLLNEEIFNEFCQEKKQNKVSHAILLMSQDKLFNLAVANLLGSLFLCQNDSACGQCSSCLKIIASTHPDFFVYPKSKNFVVDEANEIIDKATQSPKISKFKVFLISNIDEATIQAQNKILKTLEEPSPSSIFILTASNENKVLPTVVSRTRKVFLKPLDKQQVKNVLTCVPKLLSGLLPNRNYTDVELKTALDFGEGWLGKTLDCLENTSFVEERAVAGQIANNFSSSKDLSKFSFYVLKFKDDLKNFFEILQNEFSSKLASACCEKQKGIIEIIQQINLFSQDLERNVGQNLVVDNLLMKILEIKYIYQL